MTERDPNEIVVDQPAVTIHVTSTDGEHIETIDIPARRLTRAEVHPSWLAMHDAELAAAEAADEP
jgi:hypothetical protein